MTKKEIVEWYIDYLSRVGAYRKDCSNGCDACMAFHQNDNYCDITMLDNLRSLLIEESEIVRCKDCVHFDDHAIRIHGSEFGECNKTGLSMIDPDWFCADGEHK